MLRSLLAKAGWGPLLLGVALAATPTPVSAQWMYPGGYGGMGWMGFAQDPAGGYMAGLGSYARNQGAYEVEHAKAEAINLDTTIKWNRALRARQIQLAAEKGRTDALDPAQRSQRAADEELRNGNTLNALLDRIYDIDPLASKVSKIGARLSAAGVREIPFEWNTEAISLCLDQMLGRDALPVALRANRFAPELTNLGKVVQKAIDEDAKGDVSGTATKAVSEAISALRKKFESTTSSLDLGYYDAGTFLTTLASLTRLLNDPAAKAALVELDKVEEVNLGRLVAFMLSYNLRFGRATNDRQVGMYEKIKVALEQMLVDLGAGRVPANPAGTPPRADLPSAARGAFGAMGWKQLDAHARGQ
ncbi:MAG: hypothetical protein U0794_02680 [Isosphaeraceae bacterium]